MRFESHNGGQNDAVNAGGEQFAQHIILVCIDVALLHHQLHMAQARLLQAADQEFTQECRAGIAVEHADAHLFGAGQGARREIRRILELGNGGLHRFARLLAHVVLAVDDARDRHRRKARIRGDIRDGRSTLLAMLGFPVVAGGDALSG
jgi:hypothetical protein